MANDFEPCSDAEMLARFRRSASGTAKHLLTFYSLAIGLDAKVILDLGIGLSTGTLRKAAAETGGVVYSYDHDVRRYGSLLDQQSDSWRLTLGPTSDALKAAPEPIDLVIHDGAHDYANVRRDLEILIPKMRRFGIVCVHDSQQIDLGPSILLAIAHATQDRSVSVTNLPFGCGLAILRVEESRHPPVTPTIATLPDGRAETMPIPFASNAPVAAKASLFLRYGEPLKIAVGHFLRQRGLRR